MKIWYGCIKMYLSFTIPIRDNKYVAPNRVSLNWFKLATLFSLVLLFRNKHCALSGGEDFSLPGRGRFLCCCRLSAVHSPPVHVTYLHKVWGLSTTTLAHLATEQLRWALNWLSTAPGERRGRCGCSYWWACLCASVFAEHPHLRKTVPWRTSLQKRRLRRATGRTAPTCLSSSCSSPSPSWPSGCSNTGASGFCTKPGWRWFMVRCPSVTETSSVPLWSLCIVD